MSAPRPEEPPPPVLIVDAKPAPADQSSGSGTAMLPYLAPALAGGMAAKFLSPAAGLGALFVGVLVVLLLRKPDAGRTVLRVVEGDVLEVTRERTSAPPTRLRLEDLLDVTLDRTTEGGGRGGAPKERVHIALERKAPEDPIFVPDERITPIEGSEWLGRVRVFLRKHGWVPESEREA